MNIFEPGHSLAIESLLDAPALEPARPCSYVEGRTRQDLRFSFSKEAGITARAIAMEAAAAAGLLYDGSSSVFEPQCPSCRQCLPLRYPVAGFRRSASQEEVWNLIPLRQVSITFGYHSREQLDDHVAVADLYYKTRFPYHASVLSARETLTAPFILNGKLPLNVVELKTMEGRLVAGSINAETPNALIGVLYYYDVGLMHLQPGRQMVLTLLDTCGRLGKDHLYVGPWNGLNRSLQNKTQIRPYELYVQGAWHRFDSVTPDLGARGLSCP